MDALVDAATPHDGLPRLDTHGRRRSASDLVPHKQHGLHREVFRRRDAIGSSMPASYPGSPTHVNRLPLTGRGGVHALAQSRAPAPSPADERLRTPTPRRTQLPLGRSWVRA